MNAIVNNETVWMQQWKILFNGNRPKDLSWRASVQHIQYMVKRFNNKAMCMCWAIENGHVPLVERLAKSNPQLVKKPRDRDTIPLYNAAAYGNAYVPSFYTHTLLLF